MDTKTEPPTGGTLLIVEDAILTAITLRDELEDAGYTVLDLTSRHREALSAAIEHRPDLALVNIVLQGHDDGIALAVELQKIGGPRPLHQRATEPGQLGSHGGDRLLPQALRRHEDGPRRQLSPASNLEGDESLPRPEGLEVFDEAEPEVGADA